MNNVSIIKKDTIYVIESGNCIWFDGKFQLNNNDIFFNDYIYYIDSGICRGVDILNNMEYSFLESVITKTYVRRT